MYYSQALVQASHTQLNPGDEVLGAIYIQWKAVPVVGSNYGLTVVINTTQAVLTQVPGEDPEISENIG